jgi:hypothetical protein
MIEAHVQVSPDEEFCECCMSAGEPARIKPFEEYLILIYADGRQMNICWEHFATLQLGGESSR